MRALALSATLFSPFLIGSPPSSPPNRTPPACMLDSARSSERPWPASRRRSPVGHSGSGVVRGAYAEGIRPEEDLAVSEWADKYRRLPQKSSAEPGPWRTARTPYLREIMDAMSASSDVEDVVFMKGA